MTGPAATNAAEPRRGGGWARRLAGWAALLLLFYLLFRLVPPGAVIDELRRLSLQSLLELGALSLAFILGVCLIDAAAVWYAFRRLSPDVEFGPVLSVRTATMVLASFVTLVGHAGVATHLARKYRLPAGRAAGLIMLLVLIEVLGMAAVSLISLGVLAAAGRMDLLGGAPVEAVALVSAGSWAAFLALVVAARQIKPGPRLNQYRVAEALEPLQALKVSELAVLVGLKTLLAAWQIGLGYYAFLIYGLDISPAEIFAIMPATIIISSIPITPARLGTTQFSWTFFFQYGFNPAALVAFSLLFQFTLNVARWLIGAVALVRDWREFFPRSGKAGG